MSSSPNMAKKQHSFRDQLENAWSMQGSMLCLGLDPDPQRFPQVVGKEPKSILSFCKAIADATADLVCAFKPQFAYFASQRAEDQLEKLIAYLKTSYPQIPVILDAKRGDIGATAQHYAREAFDRYGADAITVNPYMGYDSIEPYLQHAGKGVIILCRTSNLGGSDLQNLTVDKNMALFEKVAMLAKEWDKSGQIALVVGATYPREIATVRSIVGDMPLLIPGIGAQGGDIDATVSAGKVANRPGTGMIINSSRAILYASEGQDFVQAARKVALETRDAIRAAQSKT
jgi:orotidine-5'-phosphate decarboxylase